MSDQAQPAWLDEVAWNEQGLIPVIAQDEASGEVLMFAWMNRAALQETVARGEAVYWSRSRRKLWHKGEESGHTQQVVDLRLDCDRDTLLIRIRQTGGIACHTGRRSCFYRQLRDKQWQDAEPVLKNPDEIYHK